MIRGVPDAKFAPASPHRAPTMAAAPKRQLNRAEHVGSFLRPRAIKDARAKGVSGAELRALEDEEVAKVVKQQLNNGLFRCASLASRGTASGQEASRYLVLSGSSSHCAQRVRRRISQALLSRSSHLARRR